CSCRCSSLKRDNATRTQRTPWAQNAACAMGYREKNRENVIVHRSGLASLVCLMIAVAGVLWPYRGCAQYPPQVVEASDPYNGGTIQIFVGDTLLIRLHSTPGTGYQWQVSQIDKTILDQTSAPTFVAPPNPIPGAEGHELFHFRREKAGNSDLTLVYVRPWEK